MKIRIYDKSIHYLSLQITVARIDCARYGLIILVVSIMHHTRYMAFWQRPSNTAKARIDAFASRLGFRQHDIIPETWLIWMGKARPA